MTESLQAKHDFATEPDFDPLTPARLDRMVLAQTSRLPANRVGCACRRQTLLGELCTEHVDAISALKIDAEGKMPSCNPFRDAPESLWSHLVIIEDSRRNCAVDLMSILLSKGYAAVSRGKQYLILRRTQYRTSADCSKSVRNAASG